MENFIFCALTWWIFDANFWRPERYPGEYLFSYVGNIWCKNCALESISVVASFQKEVFLRFLFEWFNKTKMLQN